MELWNQVWDTLVLIFGGAVVLFIMGLVPERGTEVVKVILEWLTKKLPSVNSFVTHPILKWILSFFVAWAATKGFDYNFFEAFPIFGGVDPTLTPILTAFIAWVTSNYLHPKVSRNLPGARTMTRLVG